MDTEKSVFLQSLEEEEAVEKTQNSVTQKKKSGFSGTAIFASLFIFFLFIVVLMIFIMSVSGEKNMILQSFGIEAGEIKSFLKGLVNKTFMAMSIILILLFSIGIFRGFSLPSDGTPARRNSFLFGMVSGGLIFLVVIAWIGSYAFIDKFVADAASIKAEIEVLNIESDQEIVAPIDITFSARKVAKVFTSARKKIEGYQWSRDGGETFTNSSLEEEITFVFESQGKKEVVLKVLLSDGKTEVFSLPFTVDMATFSLSPTQGVAPLKVEMSAAHLIENKRINTLEWDMDGDGIVDKTQKGTKVDYIFENEGEYPISLRIVFADGSVQTYENTIIIDPPVSAPLQAVIDIDDSEYIAPAMVSFSGFNSSTLSGNIVDYAWIFPGEKSPIKGGEVEYQFKKEGEYQVILSVTNDAGQVDEVSTIVKVGSSKKPPVAKIELTPTYEEKGGIKKIEGEIPFSLSLDASNSTDVDNDIVKYEWFLNDDSEPFLTGDKGSTVVREAGEYTLTLRIEDALGFSDEEDVLLILSEPDLMVKLNTSPENGSVPLVVDFDASSSSCKQENCKILSFEWDFGDDTSTQLTGSSTSHQYTKTGTYTATVTVKTSNNLEASADVSIAVVLPPLIACFEPSRSSGKAPLTATFNPSDCSQGVIETYEWDFGDGVISKKRKPTHTFEKPGTYIVTLTIYDENQRVHKTTRTIEVEN